MWTCVSALPLPQFLLGVKVEEKNVDVTFLNLPFSFEMTSFYSENDNTVWSTKNFHCSKIRSSGGRAGLKFLECIQFASLLNCNKEKDICNSL